MNSTSTFLYVKSWRFFEDEECEDPMFSEVVEDSMDLEIVEDSLDTQDVKDSIV